MSEKPSPSNPALERKLIAAAQSICVSRQLDELLGALESHLPALTGCSRWQLWMCDEMTDNWRPATGTEEEQDHPETRRPDALSRVAQQGTAERCRTAAGGSCYCLPLPGQEQLAGLLSIEPAPPGDDRSLLSTLDDLTAFLGPALELIVRLKRLQEQNITDDLTGLFNARHFRKLIDYELERARRYGHDLSLVFIDLDYFKKVNDTHGHLAGSQLLTEVGHFIMEHTRRVNLACRYGGDEFVLLLPSTGKTGALTLAEKLRGDIRKECFEAGTGEPMTITASFGVASYPGDARTPENLIRLADEAMYRVKAAGRDGVASC